MHSNIETQFDDILKPLRECPKDVLYHYTTSEGLLGILRDDKLWATDIFHLNDSSEFEYGRTQILFELSKKIGDRNPYVRIGGRNPDRPSPSTNPSFFEEVEEALLGYHHYVRFYVVSLCEKDNLLSQWRAYAGKGSGYSIGLKIRAIRSDNKIIRKDTVNLQRIIYRPEQQSLYIKKVLDKGEGLLSELRKEEIIPILLSTLIKLSISLKDQAFEEENEWRITYIQTETTKADYLDFRASPNGGVIPYLSLPSCVLFKEGGDRLPITEIRFGPTLHPDLTRKVLNQMMMKYGLKSVEIRGSGIPLR